MLLCRLPADLPIKEFAEELAVMLLDNQFRECARERRAAGDEGKEDAVVPCQVLPLRDHPFYTEGKGQHIRGLFNCGQNFDHSL